MSETINMAASMLQVNSLSSLPTTPFPSLLEAVECIETIHLSGGPEILPSILKRTFSYVEGINDHITKLSEITSVVGTSVLASPFELAKEKKKNDLDMAQDDLTTLRDVRLQLSERMKQLMSERTAIAAEVSQISASPGVVGPGNRTPAQRQAQLQQDLDGAGVPARREANSRAIADCEASLDTTNASILQHSANVRNLRQALYSSDITDQEMVAATATRERMLSVIVGSSSALNCALNNVITAIVKHYLLVQVPGLNVISQGISQLEVLAGDSPASTNFISLILRRQKAVKALHFIGSCFGGSTMTEAEGAVRRIQDGSPTVFLQRVGVAAYSVVNGVLATPTDTYLERMLTVARAYEKVCTTSLRVVSPQAPPTLQHGPSQSSPKRQRHEDLLLPTQSQSQGQLRPARRGFPNQRPPSGDYVDGVDTEEDEEVNSEPEHPPAKKPKPSGGAKKVSPKQAGGKPSDTPPAFFSPVNDSFNNVATAFLTSLTKLLESPGASMPAAPQQPVQLLQPIQQQSQLPGFIFPWYM